MEIERLIARAHKIQNEIDKWDIEYRKANEEGNENKERMAYCKKKLKYWEKKLNQRPSNYRKKQ